MSWIFRSTGRSSPPRVSLICLRMLASGVRRLIRVVLRESVLRCRMVMVFRPRLRFTLWQSRLRSLRLWMLLRVRFRLRIWVVLSGPVRHRIFGRILLLSWLQVLGRLVPLRISVVRVVHVMLLIRVSMLLASVILLLRPLLILLRLRLRHQEARRFRLWQLRRLSSILRVLLIRTLRFRFRRVPSR